MYIFQKAGSELISEYYTNENTYQVQSIFPSHILSKKITKQAYNIAHL